MKDLVLKHFNALITEKSFKLHEGKFSSLIHQTVVIKNKLIAFSFELDNRTKDFWVTIDFKINDKSPPALDENNVINIDFFLTQLDGDFKSCDASLSLEERLDLYSSLINKYFDALVSPSNEIIKEAIKLREKHFQASLGG
jgi:hypothetical protein